MTIVASSGRRESGHKKPEAQNMSFDVIMKVLIFIVSVIGVELPKITLHLLCFASDHLWMFRVCVVLFLVRFSFINSFCNLFRNNSFLTWQTSFPKPFGW